MKKLILIRKVPSRSTPNYFWTVRVFREDDGSLSYRCDCPRFLFRNPEEKPCFHIEQVKKEVIKNER